MLLALDLHEDLVDEKRIAVALVRFAVIVEHTVGPNLLHHRRIDSRLTDSPLSQQIFNIAVTEIESEIQPHRVLNDLGRKSVAFVKAGLFIHPPIVAQTRLIWQYL